MRLKIAAIRAGTEPVGRLPEAAIHRWLEEPLICPKCSVSYGLVVDYDHAVDRWFAENSRPLIRLLKKAIFMGHGIDHRITHYETEGVIVRSFEQVEENPISG